MRCVSLLSLLLSGILPAFAQQPDSLGSRKLHEVEIIARKPETFAAGSRQTSIDSTFLKNNRSASLAEILQNATPVYVKTYGQGMLSSLAFRGTSASHTAVLWNGFNISLPTVGQLDFSLIPVSGLETVALQHGSAGSNFGSGAIGGSVLLNSAESFAPGLKVQAQQDLGSFGRKYSNLGGSYGWEKAGVATSVFRNSVRNDFAFINTAKFGKPEEKQQNAAVEQRGFTLNANWKPSEKSNLNWQNWYTDQENEVQPNMVVANTHAMMQNRNLRSTAVWNLRSGFGQTSVRGAFFHDFMRFSDDNQPASDTDIKTYQAQAEHGFIIRGKLNLNVGADLQYFSGEVDGYKEPVSELRNSVFALLRYDLFEKLHLNLNYRQAFVPGFDPPPVPSIGFLYEFIQTEKNTVRWKGNIARGYRVPTLNDRYWPTGNENLRPEDSWNYETGLQHRFSKNHFTSEAEITAYALHVNNWIQWLPTEATIWTPQNLKKVNASGLEFSGKITYRFSSWNLNLRGNYAYTRSVQKASYFISDEPLNKQLVYTPLHTASALAGLGYKTWLLNLNGTFTGERFTDAENEIALPAFMLFHVSGSKTLEIGKCRFQVIGHINNLTNTVYQNLQYYAMPGRNYNVSLRFNLD
ncbi:TonB-dependent receptor [Adhaeribacter terreus]|uniref:TonB-dependent receptor n=1 Tax=Adhaeribacter terreus TaxID=529703 RepID=A0ABW0E5S1_9BACT